MRVVGADAPTGRWRKMKEIKMQMTNEEIVRSYNEAKHKGHQIEVLSDLNVCPKEMIIDILVSLPSADEASRCVQ